MSSLEHASILKMIEWRWGLPSLTVRDEHASNLAEILEFRKVQRRAPHYRVGDSQIPTLCTPSELDKWVTLLDLAKIAGWLA